MHPYTGNLPELYDSVPLYQARRDPAFYLELAKERGGTVLEVGCGTGRILLPTARAGITIDGLDASQPMLDRCAETLAGEPSDVRQRVKLHHADARSFDLGAQFDLITAPFRVIQHLLEMDDQLAFLATVARHLRPGGALAFDVFNPNFSALVAADGIEREDTPITALPDGRTFRRTARIARVRWADQVSEVEMIYYVSNRRGEEIERLVQGFGMRWYLKAELIHLLARAGFAVKTTWGDLDRSPFTDKSPDIIIVAELAST